MKKSSPLWRIFIRTAWSFLLLVIFSFIISRSLPGNPLKQITYGGEHPYASTTEGRAKALDRLNEKLGYNLPVFYFSVSSMAVPDSFNYIPDQRFKKLVIKTAYWSGNPKLSFAFCKEYCRCFADVKEDPAPGGLGIAMDQLNIKHPLDHQLLQSLKSKWLQLENQRQANEWKHWLPVFSWTQHNQSHYWFFGNSRASLNNDRPSAGLVHLDLGISWVRGIDVVDALKFPFALTIFQSMLVLLFSFLISAGFGILFIHYRDKKWTKIVRSLFTLLYAIPFFWVGTILLVFLANPNRLDVFPASGPVLVTNSGWTEWMYSLFAQWNYFILPFIVLSYGTVVYLTQMIFELLTEELQKPYIISLRAKGCSESRVVFHALRNCISPVMVSTMSVFPVLLSGAVVVDFLFSLHGVGAVLAIACEQRDLPVIAGVVLLSGGATMLSFSLTELITQFSNPVLYDHE